MASVRASALLVLAGLTLLAAGCGHEPAAPVVSPSDVHLATEEPARTPGGAGAPGGPAPGTPAGLVPDPAASLRAAGDRLEAVRTVALYCALVDRGQFARAAEVCARRRLWSRRALASVTGFRFRSARIYAAPDARTLVLKARVRVRVRAGRGCALPDGLAVLFFTLGRACTTVGGWLITAVSTSP